MWLPRDRHRQSGRLGGAKVVPEHLEVRGEQECVGIQSQTAVCRMWIGGQDGSEGRLSGEEIGHCGKCPVIQSKGAQFYYSNILSEYVQFLFLNVYRNNKKQRTDFLNLNPKISSKKQTVSGIGYS